jgi:hypothetical protein
MRVFDGSTTDKKVFIYIKRMTEKNSVCLNTKNCGGGGPFWKFRGVWALSLHPTPPPVLI